MKNSLDLCFEKGKIPISGNEERVLEVLALSGRILATLTAAELALLQFFRDQGRKYGVSIETTGPMPRNFDNQLRAVCQGDTTAPIWRENTVLSITKKV